MTNTTNTAAASSAAETKKCTYCGKPIETLEKREIIYRGYDSVRRKQVVKKESMDFCTPQCGGNYQMGCEG